MSESKDQITIHIEIAIPVGVVTGPIAVTTAQNSKSADRQGGLGKAIGATIELTRPQIDDVHLVRPDPMMGLGTICAHAQFTETAYDVVAYVYSDLTTPIPDDPAEQTGTVAGHSLNNGAEWKWDDAYNNSLPKVNHGSGPNYPMNKLVIWWKTTQNGNYSAPHPVRFLGKTGTSSPCGSGSGSGSGSMYTLASANFPAFWAIEVKGLSGPEAIFNYLHICRADRTNVAQCWDNQGDGTHAIRAQLLRIGTDGTWELTLEYGSQRIVTRTVCSSGWGPLNFPVAGVTGTSGSGIASIRALTF